MKKFRRPLALAGAGLLLVLMAMAADTLIVKVQTTALRKTPQFFGPVVVYLKVGDKLTKVSEQNGWYQVKTAAGLPGWIHGSAVEVSRINLLASNQPMKTQATATEAALAGKGFNKSVEASYRAKHAEISFVWVDRMLQIKIGQGAIQEFLRVGRLGDYRGAK
jgi:SH3-like domain-containing protein